MTATCTHRIWDDPDGLTCTRADDHHTGHIYRTSAGMSDETMEDQ